MVADGAKWLQILELGPEPSPTLQVIDQYLDYLIRFILDLISKTVPVYKPSQKQQPWWLLAILEAINLKRRAWCSWLQNQTQEAWEAYSQALDKKRRNIARAKQAY